MSVGTMSLVFKYDMPELKTDDGRVVPDSTAKFVLLALADHCNDEGEGAYPGVKRICKKTSMSTQTVCNALNALRHNGYTTLEGKSKADTNNYTINLAKLQPLGFQRLESDDSNGKNPTIPAARVKPSVKPSTNHQDNNNKQSLDLFVSYLGKFYSQREIERWVILHDSVGGARAEELASWAAKKEIHLMNRPSLIDSLETAARKWQDKPARANGKKQPAAANPEKFKNDTYAEFYA